MKRLTTLLVLVSIAISAIGFFYVFQFYKIFFRNNTQFENAAAYVYIDRDDTIDSLAVQLNPLLRSVDMFRIAASKKGYDRFIKPGKYGIEKGSGNNDIINTLRAKRMVVNITFNNQERLENLAGRIAQQIEPDSLTLLTAMRDSTFLRENGFKSETAISMYLPNSYEFYWDASALVFRTKMLSAYNRFWNANRLEQLSKLNMTQTEVVTLASIVQKEIGQLDEAPRVAGVYVNRLREKMVLQADPTVIFAFKQKYANYDTIIRRVLYKDLKIKSPYNTYLNRGLPPGPICMPDLSTIDAVLNYEKHNYFYFVVNPNNPGYHLFAEDDVQHNKNKKVYINWLNSQGLFR